MKFPQIPTPMDETLRLNQPATVTTAAQTGAFNTANGTYNSGTGQANFSSGSFNFSSGQFNSSGAGTFNSSSTVASIGALDAGAGFAPGLLGEPMAVVINVSATKISTGNETYTFTIQYSDDNVNWFNGPALALGATQLSAPGNVAFGFFAKHRYHQLVMNVGGTTPSITFESFLSPLIW